MATNYGLQEFSTQESVNFGAYKDWKFDTAMDLIVSLICIGAVLI